VYRSVQLARPAEMAHFEALQAVESMKICEKVRLLEAASSLLGQEIEMANKYSVHDKTSGQQLFYAVEQTDCCALQLKQCFGDCAAWSLDILWTGNGGAEKVFRMEKPWTCTCCCFNRPTVTISDANTGMELGSITDPCNCIGMDLAAMDSNGERIFSANGGCCQWGAFCPLPCGPCSKVEYEIQDPRGHAIGALTKKVPGCFKFFLAPDVDNYLVEFGNSDVWSKPRNKAMMVAMALFMDFRYFSDNPNDEGDGPMDSAGDMMRLLGGE
jgi:hypothetical protein